MRRVELRNLKKKDSSHQDFIDFRGSRLAPSISIRNINRLIKRCKALDKNEFVQGK